MTNPRSTTPRAWLALGALTLAAALLGLGVGSVRVPPSAILGALWDAALGWALPSPLAFTPTEASVVCAIRLPRVLLGLAVGAGLSVSGAALQGMFRNPLADPSLIGVSGGSALGAALALVLLPQLAALGHGLGLAACASLGAWGCAALVYRLSTWRGQTSVPTMLLSGIALNALVSAALGFLTHLSAQTQARDLAAWTLGSLAGAGWHAALLSLAATLAGGAALLRLAPSLDALLLGEPEARHLGVAVQPLKRQTLALAALVVGTSVGFTGILGFVGLLVPHLLRLWWGPSHRPLLLGSALLGAALVVLADAAARALLAPAELPLGVITALLGAPAFLALMLRERQREPWEGL